MLITLLRWSWLRVTLSALLCLPLSQPVFAQIPNLPGAVSSQLQQNYQQQNYQTQQLRAGQFPTLSPNIELYQPVQPEQRAIAPRSRLEVLYTGRLQTQNAPRANPLSQFGYDVFGVPAPFSSAQLGAEQDGYLLGVGDEVVVVLRGPEDQTINERVNRDGQVILPKLTPIQAAGRTLGDFRSDVERRVGQTFISTRAFVSLGQVRQISVLVSGDVRAPGTRVLSALATPLDALLVSGGVAKTGSLRAIKLIRGGESRNIDLYPLITQGDALTLGTLQNGDRIFVPPLQSTVAVAGDVRHPGIYELKAEESVLDANNLIQLAGGYEIPSAYRLSKVSLQPDGSTRLEELPNGGGVTNGEILYVGNAREFKSDTVVIRGAVPLQGAYPLSSVRTLGQLIHAASDVSQDAYTALALLSRRDMGLNVRSLQSFSVSRIISGQDRDVALRSEDVVYIFTGNEIRQMASALTVQTEIAQRNPQTNPGNGPQVNNGLDTRFGSGGYQGTEGPGYQGGQIAPRPEQPGFIPGSQGQSPDLQQTPGYNSQAVQQPGLITAQGDFLPDGANGQNVPPDVLPSQTFQNGPFVAPGQQQNAQYPQTTTSVAIAQAQDEINRSNRAPAMLVTNRVSTILAVPDPVMVNTLKENLVWLYDEVKDPGPYFAAGGTTLGELVQLAGGPLRTADLSAVEVTSTTIDPASGTSRTIRTNYKGTVADFSKVSLQPQDVVRFRPVFSDREQGLITITGEVRYPGTFDIRRGERLSSVLERAGGLTEQAYPLGAVFTRKSAAIAEGEANQREARELQNALATAIQRGSLTSNVPQTASVPQGATYAPGGVQPVVLPTGGGATNSDVISNLIVELRTAPALGRITITADPSILQVHPELDVVLEGGDMLYIPKRPSTVTVTGEVLNTGSFTYRNDFAVQDYVAMAGGARDSADESRIFVVLPDGSARPVEESWLTFSHNNIIPPGSTIVVPREVAPFNFLSTFANVTQITSSLALTAAALAILAKQ